jgi:streptomycin 3"-adenylyltransferase
MDIDEYAHRIAEAISATSPLVGLYVHGSAALGGFAPLVSDVDMLAVIPRALPVPAQERMGAAVLAASRPCPGTGLEMSVITSATAASLAGCRFELHIGDGQIYPGSDHPGDPDLVLHVEVCRRHGRTIIGPDPERVFSPVPVPLLLDAVRTELRWALDHGSAAYAVLNACRAHRFAAEGAMCSKIQAGEWYVGRYGPTPVVSSALAQQRGALASVPVSADPVASAFVGQLLAALSDSS